MPRNSNPAAGVLAFFETADLAVADAVLGLAKSVVLKRQRGTQKLKPAGTPKRKPMPPIQADSISTPPPPPHDPTYRTKGGTPVAPRTKKPKDVPLPGLPGPVATVGE